MAQIQSRLNHVSGLKKLLRNCLRDLRSGDLNMLIGAVALAVGSLSAVSLFADRLAGAFARDAKQLLGGDALVISDQPTPPSIEVLAKKYGLQASSTLAFVTMARGGDVIKLVALKAVEAGYPLRGQLKIDDAVMTQSIPAPGEVWVENSLLGALNIKLGEQLSLGASSFKVTHTLVAEPDRGMSFLNFAPRVMMNSADLDATELIQAASRVTYRFAVVGGAVANFNKDVVALLPSFKGVRLDTLESGRPEAQQILAMTEKFLNLVALLCALVCAASVVISARAFAAKRIDECALRRVLGQSQMAIAANFAFEFLIVGIVASLLGYGLGFGLHEVFVLVLGQIMEVNLPTPGGWPLVFGVGVGVTLLLGFGLPPVLQLAGTPPLRVLRRDVGEIKTTSLFTLLTGVIGFAALLLLGSKDITLGLMITGGFAIAMGLFAGLTFVLLIALGRWQASAKVRSHILLLATRQVLAHRTQTVVQVVSLSIGLLALFLLFLLRNDLLANWQKARPMDAPNRMVINILPEQADAFKTILDKASNSSMLAKKYDWFPMIRGRLIAVNDVPVSSSQFEDERAKRLVEREFNLSHTATMPTHNQLVSGQWTSEEDGAISVEEGVAKTLKLTLGDRLRFDIAGVQMESKISSLRKVDWQSMRANFFVLYPKANMPSLPVTYLTAFKENAPKAMTDKAFGGLAFDNQMVRTFPNITVIDLTQSINEIGTIINKAMLAVESLFGCTLAAGILVLLATLNATGSHTQRDFAMMRALGASRAQLRRVQAVQLASIGALSGFLAASMATVLAWGLAKWVFNFEWSPTPALPAVGLSIGSTLALVIGWRALSEILNQPVMLSLRAQA